MNPDTLAELLAELGPPSDIAAGLAWQQVEMIEDCLVAVADLRLFDGVVAPKVTETVSRITWHLTTALREIETLPALLALTGEVA